jgi:molybdopterin-guanine dinucleotide biosynthesis protein A
VSGRLTRTPSTIRSTPRRAVTRVMVLLSRVQPRRQPVEAVRPAGHVVVPLVLVGEAVHPPSITDVSGYAAVVLAGGAGRRFGGPVKPLTPVGGRPMLHRVLDAVADARPRVVVGPATLPVPDGVRLVVEEGGGPVAGLAAGLSTVDGPVTALLGADLPLLTSDAMTVLRRALSTVDGAMYVDDSGRRQILCGVWRTEALRQRLAAIGDPKDARLRTLLDGLDVIEVRAGRGRPWYDCDSPEDVVRAERWLAVSMLEDWVRAVHTALNLDGETDAGLVLDLARDVAHGVARPAAPLTAYLLGVAVGRGADPRVAAATVAALANSWPPDE